MIKFFFLISFCFTSNPIDNWLVDNKTIFHSKIKDISFRLNTESDFFHNPLDSSYLVTIVVDDKNRFRFNIGPRTIVSDGENWKSYDERTGYILITKPDKKIEKSILFWTKYNTIKSLPFKLQADKSYAIKLPWIDNDVRVYFNSKGGIKLIKLFHNNSYSEISKINISTKNKLDLEIGNKNAQIFI